MMIRKRARDAVKENWQVALLVVFIAALPSIVTMVSDTLLEGDLADKLYQVMLNASSSQLANPDYLAAGLMQRIDSRYFQAKVISLICWAVSPALVLGMYHYLQEMLRGNPGEISTVFSRLGSFLKGILLNILMALKVLLWALPGMALCMAGMVMLVTGSESAGYFGGVITGLGSVFTAVMCIRAWFSYAMAMMKLADKPETGIFQCLRESIAMMKGRRMAYFLLQLSFAWLLMLAMLIDSMIEPLLGGVIGSTIYMILQLIIQLYMYTACCAFYLDMADRETGTEPSEKEI